MNKTAIKNFAIWARNRLIADIKYRAGLMGITENGIANALPQSGSATEFYDIGTAEPYAINGEEIKQRRALVDVIRAKEKDSDYAVAYKYIIKEVAYTWFNRLIAVRFMEVNDYLPSHMRALSSESGKTEPDIVTNPFDAELNLSSAEEEKIIALKRDNKLDEAFRMLFIKQCNALNEILPALFEKTSDYTELLLNLSVIDQDGVVYHLVHDIPEEDFNVSEGGQVEILGWMYQYYNTELNNQVYDGSMSKERISRELLPAATTIYTPDWAIRYMVDNSLGKIWLEGHKEPELKCKLQYYLENEGRVKKSLFTTKPENIKFIDPCMGSGHILVYAFEEFMQIYENAGWSAREAAQSIVEKNLYGLDIDDRAAQLSYFAVMMKARQYDRRFFSRGVKPNIYAIKESNGINRNQLKYFGAELDEMEKNAAILQIEGLLDTLVDAKEYGSILNVDVYDWNLLNRWVNSTDMERQISFETYGLDGTADKLKELIDVATVMAQKYDVVVTNPPYLGSSRFSNKLDAYVKKIYKDTKSDLAMVMYKHSIDDLCKENGYVSFITTTSWMFLSSFEKLREYILEHFDLESLVDFGTELFDGKVGHNPIVAWVTRKANTDHIMLGVRLVDYCYSRRDEKQVEFFKKENYYYSRQSDFTKIPGCPITYSASKSFFNSFDNGKLLGSFSSVSEGVKTGNNEQFLRLWTEVCKEDFSFANSKNAKWIPHHKGGDYRKWYGNREWAIYWKDDGEKIRASKNSGLQGKNMYFKPFAGWSKISSKGNPLRYFETNFLFDSGAPSIANNELYKTIALINGNVGKYYLSIISPTLNLQVGDLKAIPLLTDNSNNIDCIVKANIKLSQNDWDSFETSWDFKRHPLLSVISRNSALFDDTDNIDLAECYTCWENECNERFNQLKANEEELNRIFIDIYGLQDELTPEVEDKDVTVRKADLQRDIKSLISYAVGCMFGRYSLNEEGLVYAGGEWDDSKYTTFIPDTDNIIPITDEEYLEDDIVSRFCTWLKTAFGAKSLETNMDFIARALGNKGDTSREIIRNYFLNDFFKDHCNTYSVTGSGKRPIYWLFDSGKQNGFKALVYLHRYNADTIGNVRVDYLYRMQRVYESEIGRMQDTIDNSKNSREVSIATKRKEKLQKQLKECREYDEKIGHLALSRIELDLDDGVKVNYRKVQTALDGKFYEILADSKNIMVKEK